jgi:hypothetical protein
MLPLLVQSALALACLLFVVSLPIAKLPIAGTMRRVAAALFLVALFPSVFFGLIARPSTATGGPSSPVSPSAAAEPLSVIAGLVLLCLLSYAILEIRKRFTKTSSKDAWSEFVSLRSSGKKPVSDPRTTHTPSLFDEEP